MQNTMLDTVVSSNSQALFDFNAVRNGEACIESFDPKDRGTERQFRFTRALLCTLLGVKSENTITNHVDALISRGVVTVVKNLTTVTTLKSRTFKRGLRRIVGELSNQTSSGHGRHLLRPATRNERNHAHSKPCFE